MPVYVCAPGAGSLEPWRHGIQVYERPFDFDEAATTTTTNNNTNPIYDWPTGVPLAEEEDAADATEQDVTSTNNNINITGDNVEGTGPTEIATMPLRSLHNNNTNSNRSSSQQQQRTTTTTSTAQQQRRSLLRPQPPNIPIRRIRHAELVLVDDVCIAYGRYWLRLRWPGHCNNNNNHDGTVIHNNNNNNSLFAGYIAMGRVEEQDKDLVESLQEEQHFVFTDAEDREDDDPAREETSSMPPSEPFQGGSMMCRRTGLAFQSSDALKLMAIYDDGIAPSTVLPPFPTELVFCRICREGLHDDADDEQPAAAQDEDRGSASNRPSRDPSAHDSMRGDNNRNNDDAGADPEYDEPVAVDPLQPQPPRRQQPERTKGPILPHPPYFPNADALQNPMLAPCECAGSMAFVHYLCVEQWRCRSRHPEAVNGLNCETCGTAYSLPPPSERPQPAPEQEDWLDAMPPHVMQALRQPHLWWQIGAAVVRRRWLRPVAPVLLSPAVALYCRARRLLKKRGVARRRWACSLCRRRARWKCVRCLRSYYCSRQCQNVSWHIIHKHVCYKPVRFWWSVVVYGVLTLLLFPGILRDPLMYDIGFCLIPISFVIMGVLGGGAATLLKRVAGVDVRGRLMEFAVVAYTLVLSVVSWGLVKGFFGNANACYGTVGWYPVSVEELASPLSTYYVLRTLRWGLLQPAQTVYLSLDRFFWERTPHLLQTVLCTKTDASLSLASGGLVGTNETATAVAAMTGCFEHLPHANADFILHEHGGAKCAADLLLVTFLYAAAGFVFVGSTLYKQHERNRRAQFQQQQQQQRRAVPIFLRPPHLHQD